MLAYWKLVPALWRWWAPRGFSPRYCLWTSCLCQMPGYAGSPPSEPGSSGHFAFGPVEQKYLLEIKTKQHHRWRQVTGDFLLNLKDASEGPGAKVVQYGITINGFKGRSVLVHSLNASPQTAQLVLLALQNTHRSVYIQRESSPISLCVSLFYIRTYFSLLYNWKPAEQTH